MQRIILGFSEHKVTIGLGPRIVLESNDFFKILICVGGVNARVEVKVEQARTTFLDHLYQTLQVSMIFLKLQPSSDLSKHQFL